MTRVGIVCGYGTDAARLAPYAAAIVENARALDLLVTSGGGAPVTEAEVLAELLRPAGVRILREPRARSSAENLLLSRELLAREGVAITELTIFCDEIRRWKVAVLARVVFGRGTRVVAIGRQGARWRSLVQLPSLVWQLLVVAVRKRTVPFGREQ